MVCYLGIGSNIGNRRSNIKKAVSYINLLNHTKVLKQSRFIQTDPVGGPPGQRKFLNAALKINTTLSAVKLLKELKSIEIKLGRIKSVRNGPRKIDLDILLYSDKIIRTKNLIVPHPRMFNRDFVIQPLMEAVCR